MHSPWPDWIGLSTLRGRLTLWNTSLVLLMTVASLLAARLVARVTLYDDADAELRAGAGEVVLALQDLYPDLEAVVAEIRRMARSHEERGWFVHFLTEDGTTLWMSDHCPAAVATFPPSNLDRDENIVQVGPYRYVRLRISRPGQPAYHVRVGTYTTGLDDRLSALVRQLIVVGGALVLLTPVVGWWLARRATQPVADILRIAEHLRPTRLSDRLPTSGTSDELDLLSQTINRLLDQVAGHVDRQQQFVADAAHELRGPVAAVQSSLEVALSKERTPSEYQATIEDVLCQTRQLTRLTNDLLLLAEGGTESSSATHTTLEFASLVRQAASMFAGVADERGVRLDLDVQDAARIDGDARYLRQVFSNLLDNAIRFTQPGGSVRITLAEDPARREAVLTVADTGRGIGQDDLPRVFDRFFQADEGRDRGDTTRGGGLGLALAKEIVERHSGRIEVTSTLGEGSRFTVRLPLA
jgi:heavy metal sensor kinase